MVSKRSIKLKHKRGLHLMRGGWSLAAAPYRTRRRLVLVPSLAESQSLFCSNDYRHPVTPFAFSRCWRVLPPLAELKATLGVIRTRDPVLLAPTGGEPPDAAAVWAHPGRIAALPLPAG